jgi:integrase
VPWEGPPVYKRGKVWWVTYTLPDGKYRCESSHSTNKQVAKRLEDKRRGEIAEGRLRLPRSNPPFLEPYSEGFLETIKDPKTKARYLSSVRNLVAYFGRMRLSQITSEGIEGFKETRLEAGVTPATINRDLAVLRRMLKLAILQRLAAYNPMDEIEFLEERKHRRQPHILTFEEQSRLIAIAPPHIRVLTVLITETGLRVGKEALPLKWEDVDFLNDQIYVRQSKTLAGIRIVPLSEFCKSELREWREYIGSSFSRFVFPNFDDPKAHQLTAKRSWRTALKAAGIPYFPIYNLRATFASRLSAAGTPDIFVAQMMGHSGTSILHTYAKAIDDSRREAIKKFEDYRKSHSIKSDVTSPDAHAQDEQQAIAPPVSPKTPYLN